MHKIQLQTLCLVSMKGTHKWVLKVHSKTSCNISRCNKYFQKSSAVLLQYPQPPPVHCTVHTRLFFIFWIRSNIFRNFSGCRRPIFKCFDTIRFVFPLAFQRRILNCSTAKTREATAKRKWKVENDVSAFLLFLDSCKLISQFLEL